MKDGTVIMKVVRRESGALGALCKGGTPEYCLYHAELHEIHPVVKQTTYYRQCPFHFEGRQYKQQRSSKDFSRKIMPPNCSV